MGSSPRCRVLRWRAVARPGLVVVIGISLSYFTRDIAGVLGHAYHPDLVDWIVPSAIAAMVLLPTRALSITPSALRYRPRAIPGENTARAGLRRAGWDDVAEVLLAPGEGRLTMIVGYREHRFGAPLRADIVDLPGVGARTVAEAISRMAPAVTVREGSLVDIVTWTRRPYVTAGPWRTWWALPAGALLTIALAVILPAMLPEHNENTAITLTYLPCFLIAAIWTIRPTVSITTFGLRLESRGRATAVPWAAVESVRIAATGHAAELTVRIGTGHLRYPPGHVLTRRVGRADLADLDAMLRAYAPPHALAARAT